MKRAMLALAVLALVAVVGCGAFGDDPVTERVTQPALVSKRQVEKYPPGSPARAFFEWWRAVQYDNSPVAVSYYSSSAGMTVEKLDRQLGYGLEVMGVSARPILVEVQENGDTATVLTMLETVTENPNGRTDRNRRPRAFNLVREDGEWKLADNMYIDRQARVYLGFTAPLREQAREQREQEQQQQEQQQQEQQQQEQPQGD
jgi:hypothetical protein